MRTMAHAQKLQAAPFDGMQTSAQSL